MGAGRRKSPSAFGGGRGYDDFIRVSRCLREKRSFEKLDQEGATLKGRAGHMIALKKEKDIIGRI